MQDEIECTSPLPELVLKQNHMDKTMIFIRIHKTIKNVLLGIHDPNITRNIPGTTFMEGIATVGCYSFGLGVWSQN